MGCPVYFLWMSIQDIIGSARLWPVRIRKLFWKKNLKHFDRILIATFIWVNGLHPDVFMEWAILVGCLVEGSSGQKHFQEFFKLIDSGKKYKLYAWNVSVGCYQDLAGNTVCYSKK